MYVCVSECVYVCVCECVCVCVSVSVYCVMCVSIVVKSGHITHEDTGDQIPGAVWKFLLKNVPPAHTSPAHL